MMIQIITRFSIGQTSDIKGHLFDVVEGIAGTEMAIEATSWAELAAVGEEFYVTDYCKLRVI